jgi:hypothetical protein
MSMMTFEICQVEEKIYTIHNKKNNSEYIIIINRRRKTRVSRRIAFHEHIN